MNFELGIEKCKRFSPSGGGRGRKIFI